MLALNKRQYVLVVLLLVAVLAPSVVFGAGMETIVNCGGPGQQACNICNLADLAQNILNDAIFIAVFLSAFLFAWAGIKMLMAPASSSQVSSAKNLFNNVLIGFIIILAAWLVINTLMNIMVNRSVGLPWNSICPGIRTGPD